MFQGELDKVGRGAMGGVSADIDPRQPANF
jgi:hypothetical protein